MRNNLSTPLIIQSRTILYYYTSKLLLPSKSPLFAYKLVCIEQPGRPGCNEVESDATKVNDIVTIILEIAFHAFFMLGTWFCTDR